MYSFKDRKDRIYWETLPIGTVITRSDKNKNLIYKMRIVRKDSYLVEQFPSLLGLEGEEHYSIGIFHSIFDEKNGSIVVEFPKPPKPIDWI